MINSVKIESDFNVDGLLDGPVYSYTSLELTQFVEIEFADKSIKKYIGKNSKLEKSLSNIKKSNAFIKDDTLTLQYPYVAKNTLDKIYVWFLNFFTSKYYGYIFTVKLYEQHNNSGD